MQEGELKTFCALTLATLPLGSTTCAVLALWWSCAHRMGRAGGGMGCWELPYQQQDQQENSPVCSACWRQPAVGGSAALPHARQLLISSLLVGKPSSNVNITSSWPDPWMVWGEKLRLGSVFPG